MQATSDDVRGLMRKGVEAFKQGHISKARSYVEAMIIAGTADEAALLLLAACYDAEGKIAEGEAVLGRLLDQDPKSVRAHIKKADARLRAGDSDAAALLYARALRLAEFQHLNEMATADVARAEQSLVRLRSDAHAARSARLNARGLPPQAWSPRLRHALDIAAGERKLYAQEPTAFAYPGLPNIGFFDTAQFGWVPALEAATPAILQGLMALLNAGDNAFRAYIQDDASSGPLGGNKALLQNRDWSIMPLCENGWLTPSRSSAAQRRGMRFWGRPYRAYPAGGRLRCFPCSNPARASQPIPACSTPG